MARDRTTALAARRRWPLLVLAALFLSAAGMPGTTHAAGLRPARGMLLVASRDLVDPNFAKTVVLLIDHGPDGAVGLVVNRPTRMKAGDLLPDIDGLADYAGRIFYGGPVVIDGLVMLFRGSAPSDQAREVFGDVHVGGSPALLERLAGEARDTSSLRLYLGRAGWAPGQLEREIAAGGWHLVPARESIVFADDPEAVWEALLPPAGPIEVRRRGTLPHYPFVESALPPNSASSARRARSFSASGERAVRSSPSGESAPNRASSSA